MLEVELKLAVEGPFAPALSPERINVSSVEELAPLDLHATYWDTSDLRLARYGVTLRHRTGEGERPGWTLKLPTVPHETTVRNELHFDAPGRTIPEDALELVTAFVRSAPMVPVARLRTRRRRWSLRGRTGEELAELVDDRVSVLQEGRVVERFREIEIEGRSMDRPALERIARVLAEDGATSIPGVPKLVRALGDRAEAPPDASAPPRLSPSDPAGLAVKAAIARGVERMVVNDALTRLGDVEGLHQMRVATRRLRSDLKTFEPLVDVDWSQPLRDELKWLGAALGDVRDLDVLLDRLRAEAGELEPRLGKLFEALEQRRSAARSALITALRSARFVDLLDRLVEAVREPELSAEAARPSADVLPDLVQRNWRKLARDARSLGPDSPGEEYHQVRVRAKRARYAAEAVAPALGGERGSHAKRFAKRAADIQDVLGELQDTVVARETIEPVAGSHPSDGPLNLAAGQMLERERHAGERARSQFPGVWKKLDRQKVRSWLKA
jgi:CHAD domain-containing protein